MNIIERRPGPRGAGREAAAHLRAAAESVPRMMQPAAGVVTRVRARVA